MSFPQKHGTHEVESHLKKKKKSLLVKTTMSNPNPHLPTHFIENRIQKDK